MPVATELAIETPSMEIQLTVPLAYEQAVEKVDHIKTLLWFETQDPSMTSSKLLQTPPFNVEGPVMEYVAILTPADKTFDIIWAFMDSFEMLKDKHILPSDARLINYDFIEEDKRFLAWVIS